MAADQSSPNIAYAVGVSGSVYKLNGSTVTKVPTPVSTHLNAVVRRSLSSFVAVGDSGVILHSSNNGMTWTQVGIGLTSARLTSVSCPPTSSTWCVAVGDAGTILTFNGTSWAVDPASGSSTSNYAGVALKHNLLGDNGVIVGSGGVVRAYSGTAWGAAQTLPGGYALNAVTLAGDGQLGLAVGVGGITFSTSNGGASWTLRQAYLGSRLAFRDVVIMQRSSTPMFGAITTAGLLVSTDSGDTWATRWQPLSGTLNGLGDDGTAVAGSTWHLVGNGGAWSKQ